MCGIAGVINSFSASGQARQMINMLSHRGPDNVGIWSCDRTSLSHSRLSIIDLSVAANQPFVKHNLVIIFNGEIYNFKKLRNDLESLHITFRSNSDTEVLLEGWRVWGINLLNRLRGMYAFAIYDDEKKEAYICRDPFGIKPLFYSSHNGTFYFASELKAIKSVLPSLQINYTAVVSSLLYSWIPESQCIYEHVKKLAPGHYLKIDQKGKYSKHCFWSAKDELTGIANADVDPIQNLEEVLYDSVRSHLVSDVSVNAFLSGGLDSSLVVAMATREIGPLDCYTIRFEQKDQNFEAMTDDSRYARIVAKKFNCNLHEIQISPDIKSLLPKIVQILDEPIGDAAAINTYLICESARKAGVKVLLSGMGADELFAGYRKHYANVLAAYYRHIPLIARQTLIEGLLDLIPVAGRETGHKFIRWSKRFVKFAGLPEEESFQQSYSYYSQLEMETLAPELAGLLGVTRRKHSEYFYAGWPADLVNRMCFTDLNLFLPSLNLTYCDRASMAASTEIRVPFVDKRVVEAAFQIPGSLKIRGNSGKYILKKVAEKWLPQEIIKRPKSSFGVPLRSWIRNDLRGIVDEYVLGANGLSGRGFLDKAELRKIVDSDRSGRYDNAQKIWHLLTLEQWFRNHAN